MNVVIFRSIWGNKSKEIPNLFNLLKSWLPKLPNSLATFRFENSCGFFLKTRFSDRHYRILNWGKGRMHMCWPKMYSGNFIGAELCWASSLIFVGNDQSFTAFTDEGGGAELRHQRSSDEGGGAELRHHWCRRSQNSSGNNWIPIECSSSERNIFDGTPENFLSKELSPKFFPLLTNCQWKFPTVFGSTWCCRRGELSPPSSYSKCKSQLRF